MWTSRECRKVLLCILVLPHPLLAEPTRSVQAVRCDAPPVIDGKLDETAWSGTTPITDLTAIQPVPGEPLSERTEIRVLFDQTAIYLGIRCFDRNPAGISAKGRERDGFVRRGDHVAFYFDTFHDRRNGYLFAVSPDEGRWDALVSNHFTANTDWDGIWKVRCTTDDKGWTAEVAIPFKTLSYDSLGDTWGFNVSRVIARTGENGIWNMPRPESEVHYAGNAGTLTGLFGLPTVLGFEFSPYVLGRYRNQKGGEKSLTGDVGFDVRWRIGSGLNAILSINTDFAETEVDQRRLNFSRFPLFYPEKRRFFLEDSGIYRFADLNEDLLIPYYTRRIGLSQNGEPVPILAAGKVSGRLGGYELGATTAVLDNFNGVDSTTVFAGRLTRPVFGDSTVGLIATAGDPRSDGDNAMVGCDFRFQTTELFDQQTLIANLFALNSQTDPVDDPEFSGHAYGLGISWPGDRISFSAQAAEISGGFDPALGFLRRNDVRYLSGKGRYLIRPDEPGWWQSYSVSYGGKVYTNLDNELQSRSHSIYPLMLRFASNDELSFGIIDSYDRTDYPFTLPGDIPVPAGQYDMLSYDLSLSLSDNRPISGVIGAGWGDYYGGQWRSLYANMWWLPSSLTAWGINYYYEQYDMPGGSIDSQTVSLWLTLRFTPRLRWANLVQYDTVSSTIGFNSRFSWEYREGHRLDLVLSQLYLDDSTGFQRLDTELVTKLGLQLRF